MKLAVLADELQRRADFGGCTQRQGSGAVLATCQEFWRGDRPERWCLICVLREAAKALRDGAAPQESERLLFERLSKALTGGNAATWDEVVHAAEHVHDAVNKAGEGAAGASSEDVELRIAHARKQGAAGFQQGWRP